jgi:hypothetical protein
MKQQSKTLYKIIFVLSVSLLFNCLSIGQNNKIVKNISQLSRKHSQIFQLSDNDRPGAWCWFQDQRAIIDNRNPNKPILLTGVVTYGDASSDKRGDIDMYWAKINPMSLNPISEKGRFKLDSKLQMDDHAAPAFMVRPDGKYLVTWSMHGNDKYIRTRISKNSGDPTTWTETVKSDAPRGGITYTNPYFLSEANEGKGQIFNGIRSRGFDSNYLVSNDFGETWNYAGRVLDAEDPWPKDGDGGRAYVKYAGDGKSKVHLFSTDDHPIVNFNKERNAPGPYLNSIYYAYIQNGKLYKDDGTVIDDNLLDDKAVPPTKMTLLLKDSTFYGKDVMRRGWVDDIKVAPDNNPFGIIQFRANDNPLDHRYFYVRLKNGKWNVNFLAYAGDFISEVEQPDYTGLAAVDAANPDVVFISTSCNPVTGKPLISNATKKQQNEIYMGKTNDLGKTWTWAALTKDSKCDNLRPIVPTWTKGKSLVLWMKGEYPNYREYYTKIVGQVIEY